MIGLFNIVGSVAMGWAVGRWRMKSLLSLVYAARAVAVLVFLLAPKTGPVVLVFAAVMGLTFLSTVPPTAGLVAKFFGPANMATLFGIVMLAHQVGGFLGAWLGGKVFEATGSYDWVWYIDIVLAVGAALVHLPIKRRRRRPRAAPRSRPDNQLGRVGRLTARRCGTSAPARRCFAKDARASSRARVTARAAASHTRSPSISTGATHGWIPTDGPRGGARCRTERMRLHGGGDRAEQDPRAPRAPTWPSAPTRCSGRPCTTSDYDGIPRRWRP